MIGAIVQLTVAMGIHMATAQSPHSPITVIDDGSGVANVQVPVGQELEAKLGANPTTGYTWHYSGADPARLRLKSRRFELTAAGASLRLGSRGMQLFVFEALAAGTEHLHFEYRRGQAGKPIRTYDLTVTVVP